MNLSADPVAEVPPAPFTVTSTAPAAPAGEVAVIDVGETTLTTVPALAPNETVSPVANPVPVIVTEVPPAVEPLVGLTAETVGTGGGGVT